MKRVVLCILVVATIMSIASCTTRGPAPYGIWACEERQMVLYINKPESVKGFDGYCILDGEKTSIKVDLAVSIRSLEIWTINTDGMRDELIFDCDYKYIKDELTLKHYPNRKDRSSYETIVFEKIEEYNP